MLEVQVSLVCPATTLVHSTITNENVVLVLRKATLDSLDMELPLSNKVFEKRAAVDKCPEEETEEKAGAINDSDRLRGGR